MFQICYKYLDFPAAEKVLQTKDGGNGRSLPDSVRIGFGFSQSNLSKLWMCV